jgi:hypothetical protein
MTVQPGVAAIEVGGKLAAEWCSHYLGRSHGTR